MNNEYKFIDLFAGLGGFRIAFENQNCKCVFSSEIDKQVASVYASNFNDIPHGDITKISTKDIPQHDILCAGFPCQAFSIAGFRKGFEDTRGTMFFEVARILKDKHPKAFILENVKGITNHDNGNTLKVITNILTTLGYDYRYQVLNAKDYGVPQNRERWYCVGIRKDLNISIDEFVFPNKTVLNKNLDSIIQSNFKNKEYKISDICKSHIKKFVKLKNIDVKQDTLAYEIRPSRCQFKCDGISPCLTAKMGTGGNNIPVLVSQMRKLTEEECLQIMGYPKTYKIGHGSSAYKQIGNSVVVPIINDLAKNLVKLLNRVTLEDENVLKEILSNNDFSNILPIYSNAETKVSEQLCIHL